MTTGGTGWNFFSTDMEPLYVNNRKIFQVGGVI